MAEFEIVPKFYHPMLKLVLLILEIVIRTIACSNSNAIKPLGVVVHWGNNIGKMK